VEFFAGVEVLVALATDIAALVGVSRRSRIVSLILGDWGRFNHRRILGDWSDSGILWSDGGLARRRQWSSFGWTYQWSKATTSAGLG
jgi:hypothetical protein